MKKNCFRKEEQYIEDDINSKLRKIDNHWNDWEFQIHWYHLELVDLGKHNVKKTFFMSSRKLFLKYDQNICHWVGHSKNEAN